MAEGWIHSRTSAGARKNLTKRRRAATIRVKRRVVAVLAKYCGATGGRCCCRILSGDRPKAGHHNRTPTRGKTQSLKNKAAKLGSGDGVFAVLTGYPRATGARCVRLMLSGDRPKAGYHSREPGGGEKRRDSERTQSCDNYGQATGARCFRLILKGEECSLCSPDTLGRSAEGWISQ